MQDYGYHYPQHYEDKADAQTDSINQR